MKTCVDCPKQISARATRCKPCAIALSNSNPELIAKRRAGLIRAFENPEVRQRQREGARRSKLEKMARDPAYRARLQNFGRTQGLVNIQLAQTPEARKAAGKTLSDRALAWCPVEHRALNYELRRKGLSLAERKAAILPEIPGTAEHAQREVARNAFKARLKHEREQAQAY